MKNSIKYEVSYNEIAYVKEFKSRDPLVAPLNHMNGNLVISMRLQ